MDAFGTDMTAAGGGAHRREIEVVLAEGPDESRKANCGTTVILQELKLARRQNPEAFARSMAKRFLINQRADNFGVTVNTNPLPDDDALVGVQFDFPTEYEAGELPEGLRIEDGWASLARRAGIKPLLDRLAGSNMRAIEWKGLLLKAEAQWKDFLAVLGERAPDDQRLSGLQQDEALEEEEAATVERDEQGMGGVNPGVVAPEPSLE